MHREHQAIVNLFGGHAPLCLSFDSNDNDYTVRHLKQRINALTNVDVASQSISTMGGRPLTDDHFLFDNDSTGPVVFNMSLRLLGGKGGFGSMLRAQGGRMNAQKTTNFEACRDLQGRRIRTVNEAKKLQEELDALPEREKEKREKLQKKIDEGLRGIEQKKYRFDDTQFLEDREQMVDSVKNAVGSLFKQQQQKKKPVAAAAVSVSMFDDDDEEDEEEDEDEQVDADTEEPPQKKQKQEETTTSSTAAKDDKGKGKAPASSASSSSGGSGKKASSGGDADSEDEDEEDSKKILSDFLETNYEEYDSEDDEDFEEGEESSEEDEDEDEEDFDAEEEEDDTPQKATSSSSSSSSAAAVDKGKGKQTGAKRKEREE